MVQYEGYTLEGLSKAAGGGGGKSGGGETAIAPPVQTRTSVGTQLDTKPAEFDETDVTSDAVEKKKMGTRGLQIPLVSEGTTTAASTGIQV